MKSLHAVLNVISCRVLSPVMAKFQRPYPNGRGWVPTFHKEVVEKCRKICRKMSEDLSEGLSEKVSENCSRNVLKIWGLTKNSAVRRSEKQHSSMTTNRSYIGSSGIGHRGGQYKYFFPWNLGRTDPSDEWDLI